MKVILISDVNDKLAEYLSKRAGIELEGVYSNLYSVQNKLSNQLIEVNRLLYICRKNNDHLIKDLNALLKLLNENSQVFRIDEIIFYLEDCGARTRDFKKSIHKLMESVPEQKYTLPISDFKISFNDAYNVLLGKTDSALNVEARERVYIKQKDSRIQNVYDTDTKKITLEPFNYANVQEYDEQKEKVRNTADSKVNQGMDSKQINIVKKFKDPYLGEFKFNSNLGERNVVLMTGKPAVGTTTYLDTLVLSTIKAGKKVLLFNLTDNDSFLDILEGLTSGDIKANNYSMRDLILRNELTTRDNLATITAHKVSKSAKLDSLRYFLQNSFKCRTDYIFIEVPLEMVTQASHILRHRLSQVIVVAEPVYREVYNVVEILTELNKHYNVAIWINSLSRFRLEEEFLSFGQVLEIIPSQITTHNEFSIEDNEIDTELFNIIVEVE